MLRLKSSTEMIAGEESECYSIYCGKEFVCNVHPFDVRSTQDYIRSANKALERNLAKLKTDAARQAHSIKLLHLASRLGMNRHGLTNLPKVNLE